MIKRERPLNAPGNHAHEPFTLERYRVGIFRMELVDQPLVSIAGMLGNFLDECLVIEPMDGFELPVMLGNFEFQARFGFHGTRSLRLCIAVSFSSRCGKILANSSRMLRRCVIRTSTARNDVAATSMLPSPHPQTANGSSAKAINPVSVKFRMNGQRHRNTNVRMPVTSGS